MALLKEQIDALLESMEANARRRHRENPGDPALAQDLVAQTKALLRTVELEHHLHICDHVQHLLLTMDVDERAADRDAGPQQVRIEHAASAGGVVPQLGIPLVDDPFDLDAYACDAPAANGAAEADAVAEAEAPAPSPVRDERRADCPPSQAQLRAGLTAPQLATLDTMAVFGWTLEFVRRPMFLPPQPVAFDRNRQRFVVVDADGHAHEDPSVRIRA
ncbi:MAG TPA: hypothetical protein VFK18_03490 [Luteimonas sp.]|nr:hypothetical protein [Luteimonas sp.]